MVIHLVLQARLTDLVQALEFVEIDGVAVRHDQPVESNRQSFLPKGFHFSYLTQHPASLWDKKMPAIARINIRCHHAIDRTRERAVQTIGQYRFNNAAFKEPVFL